MAMRWLGVIAGFLILGFMLPAWSEDAESRADDGREDVGFYVDEAQESFFETDFVDVAELLEEGLGYYPEDPDLRRLQILLEWKTGRYEDALAHLETLPVPHAGSEEMEWVRAQIAWETGRDEEAVKIGDAILTRNPIFHPARLRRGEWLLMTGRKDEAADEFQWFISYYDNHQTFSVDDYTAIARACYHLKRWKDTNSVYDKALEKDKRHIPALLGHARVLMEKHMPTDANDRLRRARKEKPNDPEVLALSAEYEGSQNRYDNARDLLAIALKANPRHADSLVVRAALAIGHEEYDSALADIDQALRINPRSMPGLILRGIAYYMTGNMEQYDEARRAVFAVHPACGEFHYQLGKFLGARLLVKESIEQLEHSLVFDPDNMYAYHELGTQLLRFGDNDRGYAMLKKANEADPYNVWTFNSLELLDKIKEKFSEIRTEHFVIHCDSREMALMGPYLAYWLEKAYAALVPRYQVELELPILVESFVSPADFSVRTIGLPGIPALGACWGRLITLDSPHALPVGQFSWARTSWHEFTHVTHLQKSENHIPRWLAEGLSTYEEPHVYATWGRDMEAELLTSYYQKTLPKIREFNSWFYTPRVMFAYYLGGIYCRYIAEEYEFDKLLALIEACKSGKPILDLIPEVLGVSPEEFDKRFIDYIGRFASRYRFAPQWGWNNIEEWKLQVADRPDDVVLQARLADAFQTAGIEVDADIALRKAMQLDPNHGEVLFVQARRAFRAGNKDEALAFYERALAAGMDNYPVRLNLGMHYLQQGEEAKDEELKRKGVEFLALAVEYFPYTPQPGSPYHVLIEHFKKAGDEAQAMHWMELLLEQADLAIPEFQELAAWHAKQGNAGKAIDYYWQLALIHPEIPEVHAPLAALLWDAGDYERAVLEFNATRFYDKTNTDALVQCAACHEKLGRREEAMRLVTQALGEKPDHAGALELKSRLEQQ